jgi:hypothetical protein
VHALDLVPRILTLDAEAFAVLLARPGYGLRGALVIVFLAGLSTELGQSVMLFANRVSPRRFLATLLVQAILFVLTFLTWVATVWLVGSSLVGRPAPFAAAAAAIGLAYAPQLLSFLVLTPYLGSGVRVVLSIWTLLATLLAVGVTFELTRGETALVALAGWLVAEVLQRTIGRPLARLGRWVRHQAAGTELRPFEPPPGMWPR